MRDLWKFVLKQVDLGSVFGKDDENFDHFEGPGGPFLQSESLIDILQIPEGNVEEVFQELESFFEVGDWGDLQARLRDQEAAEFASFVEREFPEQTVFEELLPMFSDRKNDSLIQKRVGSDASVPTIFEYLIGVAWYYLSGRDFDLKASFNLTLNGDFLPERFAGPGEGDVVVDYGDRVVLLEVTLMNANAQKRGEWEPVIRHSANLSVRSSPSPVSTFFIADELDENSINIWRAVSAVPLRSSERGMKEAGYAHRLQIMPLTNSEIQRIHKEGVDIAHLVSQTEKSFAKLHRDFDYGWRDEILQSI